MRKTAVTSTHEIESKHSTSKGGPRNEAHSLSTRSIHKTAIRPIALKERTMRNESNVHGNKSSIKSRTATAIAPPATAADLAKLGQQLLEQQRAIRAQIPDFILPLASQPALT